MPQGRIRPPTHQQVLTGEDPVPFQDPVALANFRIHWVFPSPISKFSRSRQSVKLLCFVSNMSYTCHPRAQVFWVCQGQCLLLLRVPNLSFQMSCSFTWPGIFRRKASLQPSSWRCIRLHLLISHGIHTSQDSLFYKSHGVTASPGGLQGLHAPMRSLHPALWWKENCMKTCCQCLRWAACGNLVISLQLWDILGLLHR